MVSKEEAPETSRARTSVVISITDRPGGLYQILKEFALSSINLTKIESRPAKRNLGDYLFFIDLEGDYRNPIVRDCLEAIEDMAASFRVLGSYPVWEDTASNDKYTGKTPDPVSVDEIRQNIDIIDYQIVELLARRTQMVTMIGKLKYRWDTIRDQEREKEILNRVREIAARKGVSPELMEKVYRLLFDHFVELQVRQHTGTAHPQQC
jgi:prephenate dehydratase